MQNTIVLDFSKPAEEHEPVYAQLLDEKRLDMKKLVVKGVPADDLWPALRGLAAQGMEVEFEGVFPAGELAELSGPDAAAVLDNWRLVLARIADVHKLSYNLAPSAPKVAFLASLSSLEQEFVTTVGTVRRQERDSASKLAALLAGLRAANLIPMNTVSAKTEALKKVRDALIKTGAGQQRVAANGPTILTVVQRALAQAAVEQDIRTGLVMAEMTFMQYRFEPEHEALAAQIRAVIAANK